MLICPRLTEISYISWKPSESPSTWGKHTQKEHMKKSVVLSTRYPAINNSFKGGKTGTQEKSMKGLGRDRLCNTDFPLELFLEPIIVG